MPAKKKAQAPKKLTKDEIESIVGEYFGIHPKYFIYEGAQIIKVNIYAAQHAGVNFAGLKPALELGKII